MSEKSATKIRRNGIVLAAVAALLLIGVFTVDHLLDADTYRARIQDALSGSLGRPVHLGRLDFSLFSGSLQAESLSVGDDPAFSSQPFLTAKKIRIGVEISPLLFQHKVKITGFTIGQPRISLVRAENGAWNYSSLGSAPKRKASTTQSGDLLPNLTVDKVDIKDGTITVGTLPQQGQPRVYSALNVSARSFSPAGKFPFTVKAKLPDGGSLAIDGNAGPINQRDASLTPVTAKLSLQHADLVGAGFVQSGQGISGIADLSAQIVSNGQNAQADGELHLTQLKLAKNGTPSSQPVVVQFSINQDLQTLAGKIASATIQLGKASLAVAGTYQTRGTTTLQINVDGKSMPLDDLVAFLPSLGVQLPSGSHLQGGTVNTTLAITGPVTAPVVSGPVRIQNAQLAGFDLGQKLASVRTLTGAKTGSDTTIQLLSTNLHYGPDGTRTDNLAAVIAGLGSLSGEGSISPDNALNYHVLIKLDASGLGGLATQAAGLLPGIFGSAISQSTKNGIPVTIGGTTSNPTFTPDLGKLMGSPSQPTTEAQPANPLSKALGNLLHR
jgi:AsmA protein